MNVLLDANILVRQAHHASVQHAFAVSSIGTIRNLKHTLVVAPQTIYEFWVVATRPIANNGLGLSVVECDQFCSTFLTLFPLLDDVKGQFVSWRNLAVANACQGKIAHDVRYVSAMVTHGVKHLLTFNTSDFRRFANITAIDPAVASSSTFVT